MLRHLRLAGALCALAALAACGTVTPPYSAAMDNVQALRNGGSSKVQVGNFSTPADQNSISLRGMNSMTSSVGGSYGAYLADALRQEFDLAKRIDPASSVEVSGALLKNDVDVSGFSTGTAVLTARIIVRRGSETRYDKTHTVTHTFESSFVGAIAIPAARSAYPDLVRKFLAAVYADPAFQAALNP